MKKQLLAGLFFTYLFTNTVNAQSKVRFGIKAGGNFPHFNVSVIAPPLSQIYDDTYFYAGGQLDIRLGKHFGLQPELFYTAHPVQETLVTAGPDERLHEIAMPILFKYRPGKVAIYAGPQFDFLLKAEQHIYNASLMRRETLNTTDNSFKKIGIDFTGGIEWTFKYRFGIDLRYVFGMSNRASENGITYLTQPARQRIKINSIQGGFYFRFGKKPKA